MDDEKKMTLGAEKEKQFHSRFPLSLFFSLAFLFSSDTRCLRAYDPTQAETRTRNASCAPRLSLRSRDDCNLHKLSFHFDDDVAEAPAE